MKKWMFLLFLSSQFSLVFGQKEAATFTCAVNQKDVLLGNYVEVEFTLNGAQGGKLTPPDWAGFDIVSGPNQSSSISIMNGKTTATLSYTWYIEPRDTGTFIIPTASILVDGRELTTEPVEIRVFPNPDAIIEKPEKRRSSGFDFFGREELPEPSVQSKKKRKTYRI